MWCRRITRWHDEVGPFHLIHPLSPISPACGSSFYALSGSFRDEDTPQHLRCKRCVRIAAKLNGAA